MLSRPLLVDWFCCEGAASRGYARAGFRVVGVDLFKHTNAAGKRVGFSRSRYPFPSWQGDALVGLDTLLAGGRLDLDDETSIALEDVGAFAASPPCQHASAGTRAMRAGGDDRHPALIGATRERLEATGRPYIIENVEGAALRAPLLLCWSMFHPAGGIVDDDGVPLRMERHRLFESSVFLMAPGPCYHPANVQAAGSYGAAQRTIAGAKARGGGYVPSAEVQARLLGVTYGAGGMTEAGMHQCIPPSYTEYLGAQLLTHLQKDTAA